MEMKFDHIGIPTTEERNWDGSYEPGKIHYTDFTKDEFGVEWLKFDADSPMPKMMRTMPHVAYRVKNIEKALEGREVLVGTFSPGKGVRVAFIVHNGSPVELTEVSEK